MAFFDVTLPRTGARAGNLFRFAMHAAQTRRQRAALTRLSDEQLADIGITRYQAEVEASKPVWDVPETWRR